MSNAIAASLLLLCAHEAWAARRTLTDAEKALEKYLQDESAPNAPAEATIVAFDHMERTWTVLEWDGNDLTAEDDPTERPEISLGRAEHLRTFVINTNPLVYTADRTATAEAAIDTLATLQKLTAGLGALASATIQVRPADELATPPPPPPAAPAAAAAAAKEETLRRLVIAYVNALGQLTFATGPIDEIATAAANLETRVTPVKEEALLAWLQSIESNVPVAKRPPAPAKVTLEEVADAFDTLTQASNRVAAVVLPCIASITALSEVAIMKRAPLEGVDAPRRRDAYIALIGEVRASAAATGCTPALTAATRDLADWFFANEPQPTGPTSRERKALEVLGDRLSQVLDVAKRRGDALAKAKAVLDTRPAVTLAAARLGLFHTRLEAQNGLDPALGVLEVSRSSFEGRAIEWTKKRTDTVQVAVDPSLDGNLTLRHPKSAEGSFTADRKLAENLEADFALVRTDLFSPSYEAKDHDGTDGGPSTIVETDRSSRSGKVAVMAAYRFPFGAGFAFGPQVGVGVDTDDASLFYGVSLRWRFLSLGWGETRQKVTALRSNQHVGDTLAEGVALQTEDDFDTEEYWSLSISITDLPFFTSGD